MGNNQSESASPKILFSISKEPLIETSPYWETLFNCEFPENFSRIIWSDFKTLYAQSSRNFHVGIKVCVQKLSDLIKYVKEDVDTQSFRVSIKAVISFLSYTIPQVISSKNQNLIFDDNSIGIQLATLIIQLLHMKDLTLLGKSKFWYSSNYEFESKFDTLRLMLVQILLLLDIANVQIPEFDIKHFITSISNLLQYYLNLTNKSHFHLQQNLLESSLLLILILNAEITEKQTVDFINTYLQTKSDDFTTDSQPLIITLIFNILRLATTNDSSTNTINIPLILSALHLIDIEPNSIYTPIILYVIAWIVSFPSLTIGLNDPCTFFSCKTPIHRGTYSDALIEIVSRLGIQRYKLVSLIISYVIPYSTNLSYSSAVNIFKAINISLEANDKETTKMLISAIHFMINQSVRDNVPTVIVMLKNSNILIKAMKENKDCEECQQVVQFIKSINQELKQIGKAFSSSELELFFQDPNCEHFAIPVLRPPQIEFDFNVEFGKYLKLLLAMYVTNNILKK